MLTLAALSRLCQSLGAKSSRRLGRVGSTKSGLSNFETKAADRKRLAVQDALTGFQFAAIACFDHHDQLRSGTVPKVIADFSIYNIPEPVLAKAMDIASKVREQGLHNMVLLFVLGNWNRRIRCGKSRGSDDIW